MMTENSPAVPDLPEPHEPKSHTAGEEDHFDPDSFRGGATGAPEDLGRPPEE